MKPNLFTKAGESCSPMELLDSKPSIHGIVGDHEPVFTDLVLRDTATQLSIFVKSISHTIALTHSNVQA